jgi:two-component system phosphate regulon sensor histidine kinase PhoR
VVSNPRRSLLLTANRFPGKPSPGIVLVLRDVTELRRLENLRREFVTNVSHELKTPLASISAFAETLRLGALYDPENNLKFVVRIQEQAARLHQLIIDLIHLARVESGQQSFEIVEVPVRGVVERCLADYRAAAESNQITLSAIPPADPVLVRADEDGLYTILSNLVDNAIKYTPAGGKVEVRWQPEGTQVRIDVADTGIGIAPEHQPRVFERFYRIDKARSRELGGTGLGLSIVKHLAQAFGGSVGLTSHPGTGTTFHIRLPRG